MSERSNEAGLSTPASRFVAFYWTLPIPAVGFTALPSDVGEAARASRTIRYQRERIRRWIEFEGGHLIGEYAFMEVRPDRGSDAVAGELGRALRRAKEANASLVYVRFADHHQARLHPFMQRILNDASVPSMGLPPEPEQVEGVAFDPIQHFHASRDTLPRAWSQERRDALGAAVNAAVAAVGNDRGAAERIAERLNADGVLTVNGRTWTGPNVRAFLRKQAKA